MSFCQSPSTAGQFSYHPTYMNQWQRSTAFEYANAELLDSIVNHVLGLPEGRYPEANAGISPSAFVPDSASKTNFGWARYPTFSLPPAMIQKLSSNLGHAENYEAFFSQLRTTNTTTPATKSHCCYDYNSPHCDYTKTSDLAVIPSVSQRPSINDTNMSGDGTVDPRLVWSPPPTPKISKSEPPKTEHNILAQPRAPGFEISVEEQNLMKIFPELLERLAVFPVKMHSSFTCTKCKTEVSNDPASITSHCSLHLIIDQGDPKKVGCFVGNCWRRMPLERYAAHVGAHFKTDHAGCGLCLQTFENPQLAREHLTAPCIRLREADPDGLRIATFLKLSKKMRKSR